MKSKYNKKEDVWMMELSKAKIDHSDQAGNMIVHFSKRGKPVLLEILDFSKFIKREVKNAGLGKELVA